MTMKKQAQQVSWRQ